MPPKPSGHLTRRDRRSWPGCVGPSRRLRIEHRCRPPGARPGTPRPASVAFVQCRSIRTPSVLNATAQHQKPRSRTARRWHPSRSGGMPGSLPRSCRRLRPCDAADDVGVAAEVLRGRVHHHVGAEVERLLKVRRRERVVDHDECPRRTGLLSALADHVGRPGDVDQLEERVRRRFEPDQPRPIGQRLPEDVRTRGQVDVQRRRAVVYSTPQFGRCTRAKSAGYVPP